MGASGCFTCKVETSEEFIFKNFYKGFIVNKIDYKELYKKLNSIKVKVSGNENINFSDFKEVIDKFYSDDLLQLDAEKMEIIKFNEVVLLDVYNFSNPSNRNNFHLLMLILFPLFSKTLKNKQLQILELFMLLKNSTLDDLNFLKKKSEDKNHKQKISCNMIKNTWVNDPMRILYKTLESNLHFYISTIVVGYSMSIKNFFQANDFTSQFEEITKIANRYFNSKVFKIFFIDIMGEFNEKVITEAKMYDVDKDDLYIHFDDFSDLIEKNIFLLDFSETRTVFFNFVQSKNEQVIQVY